MPKLTNTCKYVLLPLLVTLIAALSFIGYQYYEGKIVVQKTENLSAPQADKLLYKKSIALVEDGDSITNCKALRSTLVQMVKLGWFEPADIPSTSQFCCSRELWYWATDNLKSDYVFLMKEHVWSFNWSEKNIPAFRDTLKKHTTNNKLHVDLIIGMGNITGSVLTNSSITTPIVILNSRNPVDVGYAKGGRFSVRENIFIATNTKESDKQIRLFYNIIGFNTVGIFYRDTPAGRADVGLASLTRLAAEYNFKIITHPLKTSLHPDEAVMEAINTLVPQVDALFIPEVPGVNYDNISKLNVPILAQGIPTFSQQGYDLVARGLLSTYTYPDYSYQGAFYASAIGKILNGVIPNTIPQTYSDELEIYINSTVAKKINYTIPYSLQRSAHSIYNSMDPTKKE